MPQSSWILSPVGEEELSWNLPRSLLSNTYANFELMLISHFTKGMQWPGRMRCITFTASCALLVHSLSYTTISEPFACFTQGLRCFCCLIYAFFLYSPLKQTRDPQLHNKTWLDPPVADLTLLPLQRWQTFSILGDEHANGSVFH